MEGGRPESLTETEVKGLQESKLYFVNLHYQGGNKNLIAYDVCRVLLFSGTNETHETHERHERHDRHERTTSEEKYSFII